MSDLAPIGPLHTDTEQVKSQLRKAIPHSNRPSRHNRHKNQTQPNYATIFLTNIMRPPPTWMKGVSLANTIVSSAMNKDEYDDNIIAAFTSKHDETLRMVEAACFFIYNMRNARSKTCVAISCSTLYSAITGRSVTGSVARSLVALSDELSSELPFWQTGKDWIDVCDDLYNNVHRVRDSALGNKIVKVFNHVLAHAVYHKMGIEIDHKTFKRFENEKMRPTVWECATFADATVGLLLFLAKAGRHAMATGDINAFFLDDGVVTKWMDDASVCRKHAEFISNPTAIGLTLAGYVAKLDECIETGEGILKMFKTGTQHVIVHSVLLELKMVKNRYLLSMRAASFRRAPIGVFIYGSAGIAKSFVAAGLFNHYCSVRGIEGENAVCWTRDDNDQFYSGYKSHFAGVLYDDAGKFRPSKVQGVDPSIKDIISAVNNVPFITNQAELCDKGKIPFLAEWVGVTSNIGDLSADMYYNCSAAFLRRLPVRIQPFVKPEFRRSGDSRIDVTKIPAGEQYPDLWTFEVAVPVIDEHDKATYVVKEHFSCYADLLRYMSDVYKRHIHNQDKLMETVGKIGPETICACGLPQSICQCAESSTRTNTILIGSLEIELQSRSSNDPQLRKWMVKFVETRRKLQKLCVDHSERVYLKQMFDGSAVTDLFAPSYARSEKDLEELEATLVADLKAYRALSPRDKLDALTDDCFSTTIDADGDEYLDFEPERGGKCFFLQEHLTSLKDQIMKFVPLDLTDEQRVLLDDFLYHKAPVCVAEGWPMRDIVKGAHCYIMFYEKRVEDPSLFDARGALLSSSWRERVSAWNPMSLAVTFAGLYFDHPWVFNTCNWFAGFGSVRWAVSRVAKTALNKAAHDRVVQSARKHDYNLGGTLPYVAVLLSACATGAIVFAFFKMVGLVRKDRSEVGEAVPVQQVNLSEIGKKPTVRGDEKRNVWVVTERNITKLDVDPRRPQNESHAVNAVKSNILYAEIRVKTEKGMATLDSQVFVVGATQLLMNNHFLSHVPCKMKIWLGPKTPDGVQPVVEVDVEENMVFRDSKRDFACVTTFSLPAMFRDVRHVMPMPTFQSVGPAFYVRRLKCGDIETVPCHGLHKRRLHNVIGGQSIDMEAWAVHPSKPTEYGDCGSLLFAETPIGCVLVGLHCAYSDATNMAFSLPLSSTDIPHERFVKRGELRPHGVLAQVRTSFVDLLPQDKMFSDYHEEGNLMVHGQLKGFKPRAKFTGRHTQIAAQVLNQGHCFDPPIVDRMAAPKAHPWKQAQMVLDNYLKPTHSMREVVLLACADAMEEHFASKLTNADWEDIHPVPIDVAVNGFPGVPNIDAQKFTTSGGHGFRGPKLQYLSEPEEFEEWTHYRKYNDAVTSEVERIIEDAMQGIRPHAVYTASMKDELLSKVKVEAGKARVIYMCPADFLTSIRMYTLGLSRVLVRRRALFGMAVGLNTHSEEWDELMRLAERISGSNWIAGDFKAFEAVLSLLISNCAIRVIVGLCRRSGNFNDEDLLALETLLSDSVNATVDFFGLLMTLLGGEVSGHQMTTFFNCICNQLLHMYAWVMLQHPGCDDYHTLVNSALEWFDKVFRRTLGDDVYMKVHESETWYNHTTIQSVFADIGITYTMADKDAPSVPYIPLSEVSFLKRSFVMHSAFPDMYVAALDKNSIYKMLLYTVPSKVSSSEEQLASALAAAQSEAFFHDREFFDQVAALIDGLSVSEELAFRMREMGRPSWEDMIARFVSASPRLRARMCVPGSDAETTQTEGSYCQPDDVVSQTSWRVDPWGSTAVECSSEERIDVGVRLSPKKTRKPKRYENALRADNHFLANQTTKKPNTRGVTEMTRPAIEKVINKLKCKERSKAKRKSWDDRVVLQSGTAIDIAPVGAESTDVVAETTVFKNEPESISVDLGTTATWMAKDLDLTQGLSTYLSRPKLIHSYAWTENGANGVKSTFYPWQAFFGDANMSAKLRGYSLLRANIKLKFLINGSPFYYGSMLACYNPLSGWRAETGLGNSVSTTLVCASQKPHVWLENQNMSTAHMVLPFLYPYPYIDIMLTQRLRDMGSVDLIQYVPLLSANGSSSTNVDIQVYAWAEEVMLSGPTDRPVLQSGYKPDGQISGPAAAVAATAAKLKDVPILGPYAMATSMAADKLGKFASFFGFTNIPNVSDVQPFKSMPFQLASTEISEPVHKLSLQPKQETAVGSEQHGGDVHDELVISRFVGRSSFVVGTLWDTTLTPGTSLFTTMVTPQMFQFAGGQTAHTPVSYASNWFQYWRGSLRYTFKVIRSPYHRGRIQISWDRAATGLNLGPTVGNPNTYTTVMDLDEESECSFVVPYQQPSQFLSTYELPGVPTVLWSTDSAPVGSFPGNNNGVLSVRVVNRLTAPESASSATILVFVSAEDDFELAGPRGVKAASVTGVNALSFLTASVVQSRVVYDDSDEAHEFTKPDNRTLVYKEVFGERVTSFRELLHRSELSVAVPLTGDGSYRGLVQQVIPIKRMPLPPGVYNNGWWTGTTTSGAGQRVNYSNFTLITALSACFVGYKGSMNVTVNVNQPNGVTPIDTLSVSRYANGVALQSTERRPRTEGLVTDAASDSYNALEGIRRGARGTEGMALTNTKTNTGLSVQLPYYAKSAFLLCNSFNEYNNQDTLCDNNNDWWMIRWRYNKPAATDAYVGAMTDIFYGTGPDFDLIFFQNVPLLNNISVTPA